MDYSGDGIDFVLLGFNYRMTDFQAALGPDQLLMLDDVIAENNRQVDYYKSHLSHLQGLHLPAAMDGCGVTYQTYHLLFDDPGMRSKVREALVGKVWKVTLEHMQFLFLILPAEISKSKTSQRPGSLSTRPGNTSGCTFAG